MTKVQLTLTAQEASILKEYGGQLGYNLSKTIRFFISKATEQLMQESSPPIYPMSEKREKISLQALKEYRQGKTKAIDDIDIFLDNL